MPVTLKCTLVHVNTTNQTSTGNMCRDNLPVIENSRPIKCTNDISQMQLFQKLRKFRAMMTSFHQRQPNNSFLSSSEDEIYTQSKTAEVVITEVLPDNYDYKFFYSNTTSQAHITVVLDLSYNQRKMQGNGLRITMTKQRRLWFMNEARHKMGNMLSISSTYVVNTTKDNQENTKSTHKQHNNKHMSCPAHMTITVLASNRKHNGYLVEVDIKHRHNHLVYVADALRFRPIAKDTKAKYYDLSKQGHSPSSAHLEYETNLMFLDNPHLLADIQN